MGNIKYYWWLWNNERDFFWWRFRHPFKKIKIGSAKIFYGGKEITPESAEVTYDPEVKR